MERDRQCIAVVYAIAEDTERWRRMVGAELSCACEQSRIDYRSEVAPFDALEESTRVIVDV